MHSALQSIELSPIAFYYLLQCLYFKVERAKSEVKFKQIGIQILRFHVHFYVRRVWNVLGFSVAVEHLSFLFPLQLFLDIQAQFFFIGKGHEADDLGSF